MKPPSDGATINGVTYTLDRDADGNVISVTANGTATAVSDFYFCGANNVYADAGIPSGEYKISGNSLGQSITCLYVVKSGGTVIANQGTGQAVTITLDSSETYRIFIRVTADSTVTNQKYYPMICPSSVSDSSFAPYSNECPISGHSTATVTRTGKNLLNASDAEIGTAWNGASNSALARLVIPCKPSAQYTLSLNGTNGMDAIMMTDSPTVPASRSGGGMTFPATFTTGTTSNYIILAFNKTAITQADVDALKLQLELGSTATAYAPYQGTSVTIDLDGERFGGTVDVLTGVMTVTKASKKFSELSWSYYGALTRYYTSDLASIIVKPSANSEILAGLTSEVYEAKDVTHWGGYEYGIAVATNGDVYVKDVRYTSVNDLLASIGNNRFVYPLAEPFTVQLSEHQLSLLQGENNVWSNTGDIAVTYRADTKRYVDNTPNTYYVKGTQTASTGSWTGNLPEVDALYEGLTIDYYLPYAGSGNATLNLTLKNGIQTGDVPCYIGGLSRLTTHIDANYICRLIYQTVTISGTSYTGWYLLRSVDNNDSAFHIRLSYNKLTAVSNIYRYQLIFHTGKDTATPLNNANNNTGTTKSMITNVDFDPFSRIYYWYSTATWSASNVPPNDNCYYQRGDVDIRYSINCGTTLTVNKLIYLKVVPQNNGMVRLASDPCWTQTLPNTADGYWYILLGRAYSNYQITLFPDHPVYYHDGTALREVYSWDAPRDGHKYVRQNGTWVSID